MRLEGLGMRLYRVCTCIHNAFHTRKCNVRAYLNFSIWGAKLLAEVENMAVLQFLTLGGSGGILPQEILAILCALRHILVHSEAYREAHRASGLRRGSSSFISSSLAKLLDLETISIG